LERWLKREPIAARRTGILTRGGKWMRRNPMATLFAAAVIALAAVVGWNLWKSELIQQPITNGIAVLPFENLNNGKEDGAFVDGVQDDVLTKLAKIADLKVISRTSVMEYRGRQNVHQIGEALRVSHVLEGSARRNGNRIHLNAQLIDARTDTHVWAEQYDRDLNQLFAIQSEIAEKVAEQLRAKLSSSEEMAIQRTPTTDLTAYDLYARAHAMLYAKNNEAKDFLPAIDLLDRAVARDPSFFDAYCDLAFAHDAIYFDEIDYTPARLALARSAIQQAFRLRPGAGEAHFAQAVHLYRGYRDYDGALAELEVARQTLPNNARIFQMMGNIQRRNGRWEESMQNLERAAELDPRDVQTLEVLSETYQRFGRIAEAKQFLTRVVAAAGPDNFSTQLRFAEFEFDVNADARPVHQAIESIRAANPAALRDTNGVSLFYCLGERDAAAATEALSLLKDNEIWFFGQVQVSRAFMEGLIARMAKDDQSAQLAFTAARAEQEKIVQARPDFGPAWCVLGLIDAGLGRKEEALREGRRAVELLPVEKDALIGGSLVRYFAVIAAWVGEKDLACEQLAIAVRPPSFLTYGNAKLMPLWDPLRGEPCFEKIVNSLAPK
jgi:TolB-like protein/Tfp pilus assembly protein PilF